jgi:hypothetical protein
MTDRIWKFSRSHDICYTECPRKAYLTYYYGGKGMVRKGFDLYQATGSLTHAMLEQIMRLAKETGGMPFASIMNAICNKAVAEYRKSILEAGFSEFSGEVELEMQRQAALAEGLARVWTRVRLPYILDNYNIIAVEEEHEIPFGPGQVLMSRLDGVLERKADKELFAGPEFKTTGWMSEDYVESFRYSTQTLSHSLDIENIYGRSPAGVQMEFLYKGMKRKGEDGQYTYYSPLVRAFKMVDSLGNETYGFDSALGKKRDWTPFDTFVMGMESWVAQLPDDVVDGILFNSTVYRSKREQEIWQRQTSYRQALIQGGLIMLNENNPTEEAATQIMDQIFPARLDQYCVSNMYKKKCPYKEVCFGEIDDPLGSGLFVERTPHHEAEFEES